MRPEESTGHLRNEGYVHACATRKIREERIGTYYYTETR